MSTSKRVYPDGGWAWLVVLGSWGTQVCGVGLWYSYGALLPYIVHDYGSDYSTATFIHGLAAFFCEVSTPVANSLAHHFGTRKIVISGGLLATLGLLLSAFVPSANYLIVTYGIIFGFGISFTYGPVIVVVSQYFDKRRGFATILACTGTAVSGMIMPPIIGLLIDTYSITGCFIILAGISLNTIIFTLLINDWGRHNRVSVEPTQEETTDTSQDGTQQLFVCGRDEIFSSQLMGFVEHEGHVAVSSYAVSPPENIESEGNNNLKIEHPVANSNHLATYSREADDESLVVQGRCQCIVLDKLCFQCDPHDTRPSFFDLSLLKSGVFLAYVVAFILSFTTIVSCFSILVSHAEDNGVSEFNANFMLSTVGGLNLASQVFSGWFLDRKVLPSSVVYLILTSLQGVLAVMLAFFTTEPQIWVFTAGFGLFGATSITLNAVVLGDVLGVEKLHSSFGLVGVFHGFAAIGAPYFLGLLRDLEETWKTSLLIVGSMSLVSTVVILIESLVSHRIRLDCPSVRKDRDV